MSLDVTPVGTAAGSGASTGPARPAPDGDPFGSRPTRRRRGWIRIVVGALLVLGGIVASVVGILDAVDSHAAIDEKAVTTGTVRPAGAQPERTTFEVPAGARRDYTVYVKFDGLTNNTPVQELAVRDTACIATSADGDEDFFRGARQGVAVTLGQTSSIGHFSAGPGKVQVFCAYTSGTRSSRRTRPDALPYVVTPGKPSVAGGGALTIVGGVFGSLAGGFLIAWGWRRRRLV